MGGAATVPGPRRVTCLLVFLALAFVASCDRVPLTAPTGATIRLTTNTQILPVNGTAQITASVYEAGGNPVQNGTVVTFTTSLGTLTPSQAGTTDSTATVTFNAGSQSGTAVINAHSGPNSTGGTTGTGGTPGTGVSIVIGAAAAASVVVTASPSSVSQLGGTSVITASLLDTNNNGLPGVPVFFSTDQGNISPVTAITNAVGQAQTTFTSTGQSATITATAGAKTGTAKVSTLAVPTVTITGPSTTPTVGLTATFAMSVAAGSGSAPITSVVVDFGDGSLVSLGAASGSISVPHIYLISGTFNVVARATDASGQTTSTSVPVVVFPAVPFTITVSANPLTARVNTTVVLFTATPNAGAPVIATYTWDFGDGTPKQITSSPSVSHQYTIVPGGGTSANVTVNVTAVGTDGRNGTGAVVVTVTL